MELPARPGGAGGVCKLGAASRCSLVDARAASIATRISRTAAAIPELERQIAVQENLLSLLLAAAVALAFVGRDLARLIEVAALHIKLREAGHNAGAEFSQRVADRIRASDSTSGVTSPGR